MEFRLTASGYDFWIDVRVRSFGERWMAVAHIADEPEIGLGHTARQALEASLASLGRRAAEAFLSDTVLLAASAHIAQQGAR